MAMDDESCFVKGRRKSRPRPTSSSSVSMALPAIHCQHHQQRLPSSCSSFSHKYLVMNYLIVITLIITMIPTLIEAAVSSFKNPYEVLGVKQSSSITEIKHQYKLLVRNWHPDKNSDPEAESKFIEINKAYELLSDPERRQEFDRFGTTEDTPNFRSRADYSSFKRFEFDPFESMFTSYSSSYNGDNSDSSTSSDSGYKFQFNPDQGSLFRKQTVTIKAYENRIVPDSFVRPYLILVYGDLCLPCLTIEPVWQRLVHELEPLGVGFATIHSSHESILSRKLSISTIPTIIGLADGIVKQFKESGLNLIKVIEFIRRLLPRHLITTIDDTNYVSFLNGWSSDNRMRVVFVNHDKVIRLRYLLLAFKFKDRFAAAHLTIVSTSSSSDDKKVKQTSHVLMAPTSDFMERYSIDTTLNSMLIFNEDITRPIATLSGDDLKTSIMSEVLESNKFLLLPRLSSQSLFNQLCPVDGSAIIKTNQRKLCVILVTNNHPGHDQQREALRTFIRDHNYSRDKFRFMYLFAEKQQEFVNELINHNNIITSLDQSILKVLVLWRVEANRIMYQWLPHSWDPREEDRFNETKEDLVSLLDSFAKNLDTNMNLLSNDVKINELIDEGAHGLIGKMIKKIMIMTDGVTESIGQKEILPFVSVVLSLGFIMLIGYIMQYLVKMEEESIQERYRRLGRQPPGAPKPKTEPKLNIHELRSETYNGLVRLLKPGCRTIVLLVDAESKDKLLAKFHKCVYPYRKNKTLMFSHLMLEKNLEWYRKILQQTLGEDRELNINPKNCIGTVISLNGFRKYFCVFHAKHPESSNHNSNTNGYRRRSHPKTNFMGFEETDEDDEMTIATSTATAANLADAATATDVDVESGSAQVHLRHRQEMIERNQLTPEEVTLSNIVFEEHLLDGLPNWLDRLFDGTTQKYHIQYWPDHMK